MTAAARTNIINVKAQRMRESHIEGESILKSRICLNKNKQMLYKKVRCIYNIFYIIFHIFCLSIIKSLINVTNINIFIVKISYSLTRLLFCVPSPQYLNIFY